MNNNYPCNNSERCGWEPCRCEENDFRYSMELGNALRNPHIPGADNGTGSSSYTQAWDQ